MLFSEERQVTGDLTDKQRKFCDEYLIDCNATRAYKAAYPNVKKDSSAAVCAAKLLRIAKVQEYINQQLDKISSEKTADAKEVMEYLASNMMTAFHNAICSVQSWFYNLLSTALTVIEGICAALNKLPFVEFDYSGISSAADDYASKAAEAAGNKEDYKSIGDAFNEGMSTFDTFQDGWAADAFNAGASWGDGVADKVSGMFSMDNIDLTGGVDTSMLSNDFANNAAQTAANTADTADSAGRIADSVDISKENLKYLRDIAETEAINRFTTAEIEVTMNNNNTVSSDMDIDGMVDHLSAGVLEAMEQAAEGVH